MFTGIVEEIGSVKSSSSGRLTFAAKIAIDGAKPGDSIAVNGVCLTATSLTATSFSVDVMPETLRRTNLGALRGGDRVNLERAMAADGRFGGHFVQGHVDDTGKVSGVRHEGEALRAMRDMGAPVDDIFAAAKDAGRQLVKTGLMSQATLDIISRDLLPIDMYVNMANEQFRQVMAKRKKKG